MTSHYTHPEAQAYRQAAEDIAALVDKAAGNERRAWQPAHTACSLAVPYEDSNGAG